MRAGLTWQPRAALRKVRMVGDTGAAPVIISLTRPPRLACRQQTQKFSQQRCFFFFLHSAESRAGVSTSSPQRPLTCLFSLCPTCCWLPGPDVNKRSPPKPWIWRNVSVYLHFLEDEFVPHAVRSNHSVLQLWLFPSERKVQHPSLQGSIGLTEHLREQEEETPAIRAKVSAWQTTRATAEEIRSKAN